MTVSKLRQRAKKRREEILAYSDKHSPTEAATKFGVSKQTVYGWRYERNKNNGKATTNGTATKPVKAGSTHTVVSSQETEYERAYTKLEAEHKALRKRYRHTVRQLNHLRRYVGTLHEQKVKTRP
jgi:transposase